MPATLRTLLAEEALHLRMLVTPDASVLDRPIAWAHSSDFPDPTPWLEAGQLLLTDGTQIADDVTADDVLDYCTRLRDQGLAALGFATHIVHEAVPAGLIAACERTGLALVEVGASTPFVSIVRFVADRLGDDRTERLRWSLEAQRAIARAAVRPDGLGEILRTLAARLEVWVALYDAAGTLVQEPGLTPVPASLDEPLAEAVQRLLARGMPAAARLEGESPASLQTIGQGGSLRGVLAVGTPARDAAEHDLVVSVIALASIALEQQRALDASRRRVREAVLELLLAGSEESAHAVAATMWASLPEPPLTIASVRSPKGALVLDGLEAQAAASGGALFHAERGDDVVVLAAGTSVRLLDPLIATHGLHVGLATVARWSEAHEALERARLAAASAPRGRPARFESIAGKGMLGVLRSSGGVLVARSALAPLEALSGAERARLLESARAWLEANGAWDPAAKSLGIHRHTLRARIGQLAGLLELDLESFAGRVELWSALELTR